MISKALGNILYISRACNNFRRQKLSDQELFPSHQMFISYICRHPGTSQENMASSLGMDKSMVAHQIVKLERMGYITRQVSRKDGRVKEVFPTEKAEQIYPEIHEIYEEFTDRIFQGFSQEEIDLLTQISSRVRDNAEELLNDTPLREGREEKE